jgi:4a-hydroxytetrahydrobiopterin dehydratase
VDTGELTARKCVACRRDAPRLTPEQAREYLAATPGWSLSERCDRLTRTFTFKDFRAAMGFVNRVADLAEEEGHHPDFAIHWNRVDVVLWTHKIGGLHENDFIMAAKIGGLAEAGAGADAGS